MQIIQFKARKQYIFPRCDAGQKLAEEAKNSSTCIPIGEGENCW